MALSRMTFRVTCHLRLTNSGLPTLILLCLLLTGAHKAAADSQNSLYLQGDEHSLNLLPWLQWLRDPEHQLDLQDVQNMEHDFHDTQGRKDINFAYTADRLWLRLTLSSRATIPTDWVLEMQYPSLDHVILYDPQATLSAIQRGGDLVPRNERSIDHLSPAFRIRLEPGETRTLYIQANSQGSLTLDATLWQLESFVISRNNRAMLFSAYLGMLVALGGYNLLLFLRLRESPFGLYVLFLISFTAGAMAINGIGPQFLWPSGNTLSNRILPTGFTLSATFALLFARAFLNTRLTAPHWDRLLLVAAVLAGLASLFTLLVEVRTALQLMSVIGLLTTLLIMICGITCMFKGIPAARIFVLAWGILLASTFVLALRNFGVVPSTFLTVYTVQIGSALELLLLSFGLAARFNAIKRQKEAAQMELLRAMQQHEQQLELRVAERTRELEYANARLEALALEDPLTGLANRTALGNHLQQAMLRTSRRGDLLALLMMDLDGFKPVNDRFGHECGDQVLVEVAGRLRDVARKNDLVARMGGDEFVIVCENIADINAARDLAERILQALQQPMKLGCSDQIRIAASIGISLSDGLQPTASTLLNQADQAMYRSKRDSREPISLFSETPRA